MSKVAIFGKPASGKSTLAKDLAEAMKVPLHSVDSILYKADGQEVALQDYKAKHAAILSSENWILEGFAPLKSLDSFSSRLAAADTLIYIELPYLTTYWLVFKRFIKSIHKKPEGWPEGSSVLKGTINTCKILKLCPRFWNEEFLLRLQAQCKGKQLFVIRSLSELNRFVSDNAGQVAIST